MLPSEREKQREEAPAWPKKLPKRRQRKKLPSTAEADNDEMQMVTVRGTFPEVEGDDVTDEDSPKGRGCCFAGTPSQKELIFH